MCELYAVSCAFCVVRCVVGQCSHQDMCGSPFRLLSRSTTTVPGMFMDTEKFYFATTAHVQAVEIPFEVGFVVGVGVGVPNNCGTAFTSSGLSLTAIPAVLADHCLSPL
jgi:hypothetical protein